MTIRSVLLATSLAANAVLLGLAFAERSARTNADFPSPRADVGNGGIPTSPESEPAPTASPPPRWTSLATSDLRVMMERLLAAGFPRHIASAIVEERMAAATEALYVELWGDETRLPYWRFRDQHYSPATRARLFRHMAEEQAVRHELLTRTSLDEEHNRHAFARAMGINDPEKMKALLEITSDYFGVRINSIARSTGPDLRQQARETAKLVEQEQAADITALLTPAEYHEYQLRQSDVASRLRSTLGKYCTTEEEYRALYAACAALKPPALPETRPSTTLTNQQLLEQAKRVLPPDRYAEVKQAFAPGAERLNRLAGRLGLSLVAVKPVHVAQQELKARAAAVRDDGNLRPVERSAQLAAFAEEATQKITAALGESGFEAYREYDGAWIGELTAHGGRP